MVARTTESHLARLEIENNIEREGLGYMGAQRQLTSRGGRAFGLLGCTMD